ncbi:Cytochrome b/b6 domain protein [Thioalkalivibrio sp. K90mix]|jgi:ubiquinol-cytochrome c reductase cytochrome b subunit|uniref:cytochrome b n=1 Tax=unclassified Thioalkalivibrio TaxID=2621013 RepID=UPI000195A0AC|nr:MULTISPECIES: cytochrome b N-terminal domain-containing protein [unclassified Thioalkalivibrio]ADC72708.1 Cytochrome b/b6 domain protein [Thioalkalivibrio sp. K90mix]
MAGNPAEKWQGGLLGWVDARFPLSQMWNEHLAQYYAPKNFNFWYFFGSLALLVLVIQIVSGIFLTMFYKPDAELAFASVEYIMRDVEWGWLIRYMHSTGASMFFVVVYLHMFRALLYGSYKKPRELIWIFGVLIYLVLMAEAFAGYLLPWGQMSYWGAQVIVNLFQTIPYIGPDLVTWIRGDFLLSDATLTRFFALHVIALPLVLILLVAAHIIALHEVGSNNPDGVEIKKNKDENGIPKDGIPFHPYYTVKDIVGVGVFLMVFAVIMFFFPMGGGLFLKPDNMIPADPLVTPELIPPVWYFTSMYSVLRSVPDPFLGVVAMGLAVVMLFFIPWLDRNPVLSMRYRSFAAKFNLAAFVVAFVILGWLGLQQATTMISEMSFRWSLVYFAFFFLLWFLSRERSAAVSLILFAVVVGIYTLYDITRFDPSDASLIMWSWLIPTVHLFVCMVVPVFARGLGRDRAVPERVTS